MKIEVTEEDIKNGVKRSLWTCPIALAIIRKFNVRTCLAIVRAFRVTVLSASDDSADGWLYATYTLPQEVTDWIKEFDEGGDVAPISFSMRRIA